MTQHLRAMWLTDKPQKSLCLWRPCFGITATTPGFCVDSRTPKSGPHACAVSTLQTEPSLHPRHGCQEWNWRAAQTLEMLPRNHGSGKATSLGQRPQLLCPQECVSTVPTRQGTQNEWSVWAIYCHAFKCHKWKSQKFPEDPYSRFIWKVKFAKPFVVLVIFFFSHL